MSYEDRAHEAEAWALEEGLEPAAEDAFRICLVAVDVQNTFCIPAFELFVAGRSGTGAIDDNRRLCEFVYRNLDAITQIVPTLDTHQAMQVFHAIWLLDEDGNHPEPFTLVSAEDVTAGRWRVDPAVAEASSSTPTTRSATFCTTRGPWRRAASTSSRSGRTTRCSAASVMRSSPRSRRRSSSTRSRVARSPTSG